MNLKDLIPLIQKLTEGKDLTVEEAMKSFKVLESKDNDSYYFFTFLAALHAKGETSDELLGFYKSNEYFLPSFKTKYNPENIIDLSGTGGDKIKTPNVSTAASFILASKGAHVAKQAFSSVTGYLGSSDLMEAFGIDPIGISAQEPDKVKKIFNEIGMVVYHANAMANKEERKGFFNWVDKRGEIGLNHTTIYHLAANVYSAMPMKKRVYGVFDKKYMMPLAKLFQKLNYSRGIVCNGVDGLDEVSNIGSTKIIEFEKNSLKEYIIEPGDIGIQKSDIAGITLKSSEEGISDFLRIVYGEEKGAKKDLVVANAAAGFYVLDEVSNLSDGVKLARKLIDNGKVAEKLEEYVNACGEIEKLKQLKEKHLNK